jgi:hypothetical protein
MTKKLSGADWRLVSAILAVIILLVATQPSDDCDNCVEEKLTVTFTDSFNKQQEYKKNPLPNAIVIVHLQDNKKNRPVTKIPMKRNESKTVQLEGREVYTYIILELEWDVNAMNNLGLIDTGRLWIDQEYAATFATAISCISVGVVLVDTTISFPL